MQARPFFRMLLLIFILSSCIGCDQVTKRLATEALESQPAKTFFNDTVRLELAANSGGFLSLGSTLSEQLRMVIFVGFSACMMLAVTLVLLWKKDIPLSLFLALSLVLAGGIGNLIDRVSNDGLVTDFINLGLGPIRTGIFNVADIAVTCGAVLIAWHAWGRRSESKASPDQAKIPS